MSYYETCGDALWEPESHRPSAAFSLYAMEYQRDSDIEDAIEILVSNPDDCWNEDFQNSVFSSCGLDYLTEEEYSYILNQLTAALGSPENV